MTPPSEPVDQHFCADRRGPILEVKFISPQLYEHLVVDEVDVELQALVDEQSPRYVLFDFSSVDFCSTSIINALLRVRRRVVRIGGEVVLAELHTAVRSAFRVLNLDTVFDVYQCVEEARDALLRLAEQDGEAGDGGEAAEPESS